MIGWAGFALGLIGATTLAFGSPFGWLLFLASNVFWIAHALEHRNWPLLAQMAAFCVTSTIGGDPGLRMTDRERALFRALQGIASCATQCGCCGMHRRIAEDVLAVARASLSREEAIQLGLESPPQTED
jgi:hypothetical protein